MTPAVRCLPPLSVIAAFALPAVLLRPAFEEDKLQHTICLDLPIADQRPAPIVELARGDLEGCLLAWNEHEAGDADMLVRLRVIDGHGTAETESGPGSPSLWLCVAESIARIEYAMVEDLEADVFVRWMNGHLKLSMSVMNHVPKSKLERARDQLEHLERQKAELEREIERRRARRH